mmetsp:Transcript_10161/g.26293  ORF Transcript_10161/g.26293 Transcript_10161/m.26293 type:complete len:233 (+) Transcript_10161:991-1689(+)
MHLVPGGQPGHGGGPKGPRVAPALALGRATTHVESVVPWEARRIQRVVEFSGKGPVLERLALGAVPSDPRHSHAAGVGSLREAAARGLVGAVECYNVGLDEELRVLRLAPEEAEDYVLPHVDCPELDVAAGLQGRRLLAVLHHQVLDRGRRRHVIVLEVHRHKVGGLARQQHLPGHGQERPALGEGVGGDCQHCAGKLLLGHLDPLGVVPRQGIGAMTRRHMLVRERQRRQS